MADKKVIWGSSAGIAVAVSAMLAGLYQREGGYVDNPSDRGGKTNYGVTEKVAREAGYKGDMRVFPKQCETEKDVCADKIYYKTYIEDPGFVPFIKLSPAIGDELFDTGVNMGTSWPAKWLQQSLNAKCGTLAGKAKLVVDGKLGLKSVQYFEACQIKLTKVTFCKTILDALDANQKARYDAIVRNNPSQKIFYKGWINHRIGNVDRKRCSITG